MWFLINMKKLALVYLCAPYSGHRGSEEVLVSRALTIWTSASELGSQCITAFKFNGPPDGGQTLERPAKRNWILWVCKIEFRVCMCVRMLHTPAWIKVSLIGIVTVGPSPLSLSQNTLIYLPVPEPFLNDAPCWWNAMGVEQKKGKTEKHVVLIDLVRVLDDKPVR